MDNNKITTWQQGCFIETDQHTSWSNASKDEARVNEKYKVKAEPDGPAICYAATPELAKWIAERLNLAARMTDNE